MKKKLMLVMVIMIMQLVLATDIPVDMNINANYILVDVNIIPELHIGEILICDGTCAYQKTLDPATQFTVKVKATGDVNSEDFDLNVISDNYVSEWDAIKLEQIDGNSGNSDGCVVQDDYYCLKVLATDWTTKFIVGTTDVSVNVHALSFLDVVDTNSTENDAIIVNSAYVVSSDATSGTYSGNPNDENVAIITNQTNSYIEILHEGNTDLNVGVTCTDLNKSGAVIDKSNEKFNNADNVDASTNCNGAEQIFLSNWTRGTYPNSNTQNQFWWLSFPSQLNYGAYTGTLTYSAGVS